MLSGIASALLLKNLFMRKSYKIFLFLISVLFSKFVFSQCAINLVATSTGATCITCNNGSISVTASGGTAPYTYVWTNNVTTGTATLAASKDNSIYEQTTGNSNGAGQNLVAGETNAGFKNRALLAFDIAGNIPAGATVTSTNLKINMLFTSGIAGPQTQSIHKLLQNWGEGTSVATQPGQGAPATTNDATWIKTFFPATDWMTAGGTFNATASAATVVNQQAIYTWSSAAMVSDIQSWLNTPASNFGWLLKGDETGNKQAKRYGSRENVVPGNAPSLIVNYGPTVIGNTSTVSNLAPGTYIVTVADFNGCTVTATVTVGVTTSTVATTYRGAFAPAPTAMWTDNWTNWDPQNTYYPASNVTIAANTVLTGSVTWTKNNTYKIQGLVFVDSLATLTIEPGTVIRGDETVVNSSLVVQRGGKLIANGTACNPIVFTSNKAAGVRAKADWGGIILLGRAKHNLGTQNAIEGMAQPNLRVFHGGTNDADNSGVLKYVRIEYGGYVFSSNNEINGLTMGSVGSGTTIDYVQASFINDDAFEWFGGTVNCSHLVSYRNLDDDFDTDNGFSGLVQFCLSVKDPVTSDDPLVSTSEGFESDNNATATTATPKTTAKFYNMTQVGAFRCANNAGGITAPSAVGFRRGVRYRRQSDMEIYNSILMNNWRAVFFDNAVNSGIPQNPGANAKFINNIIAMDTSVTSYNTTYNSRALFGEGTISTNSFLLANGNTLITTPCDVLTNAWDFTNPDYRPNSAGSGGALAGCDLSTGWEVENSLFTPNACSDLLLDVIENGVGSSNGTITLTIQTAGLGWDIKLPGGAAIPASPTLGSNGTNNIDSYTNGNWLFSYNSGTGVITITSKPGYVVLQSDFAQVGLKACRKGSTSGGTNQNLGASVSGGSDVNSSNDGTTTAFSAN
jgi:hypothetical protein